MNITRVEGSQDLPTREVMSTSTVWVIDTENDLAVEDQLNVMLKALQVYEERNHKYKDNWKRMGWRGVLIRIRERADRLWDGWWDRSQVPVEDEDDALDLINFAAIFVRATRGGTTRDGSWWS